VFAVVVSILYLVDIAQRSAGSLRAKTSVSAHEQIEPAYLHDVNGVRKSTFKMLEPVFTHENFRKNQSCHTTTSNVFVNEQTKILYRGESYLTWVRADTFEISESLILPQGITPGVYRFVRKTVSFCAGEQVYYTTNFDLKFEIVP
jgi:hypothetical protein